MHIYKKKRSNLNLDNTNPFVVGAGLVALDVLIQSECKGASTALGGSAGNVLAILSHLGWRAAPVGQLGVDLAANYICNEFEQLGADVRFLSQSSHLCTPIVYQLPGTNGSTHEFSFACPFCGKKRGFHAPDHDTISAAVLSSITSPQVFFFDRITPWAIELAEKYRTRGTLVMFEPSVIDNDPLAFERAIRASHVLKYADDRIKDLMKFDRSTIDLEVQTLGQKGLRYRTKESPLSWVSLPAFSIPYVTDTAGAGDWCSAGFLYGLVSSDFKSSHESLLSRRNVEASLRFGQTLAALNCMRPGARGLAKALPKDSIFHMASEIKNRSTNSNSFTTPTKFEKNDTLRKKSVGKFGSSIELPNWLCCEALLS
jgi:fructokinase